MKKKCVRKNRTNSKISLASILLISLLFSLASCYENIEGCLDIQATNFDLDADIRCDSCCVYPSLKINFLHQYSDTDTSFATFSLNKPYSFQEDRLLELSNLKLYLSDFKLIREDNMPIGVENILDVVLPNDTISVEDNFVLIDRSMPSTYNIGVIRQEASYSSLEFRVGLENPIYTAKSTTFDFSHPLYLEEDSDLYKTADNTYLFARLDMQVSTPTSMTIPAARNVERSLSILLDKESNFQTIRLPFTFSTVKGFDTNITLRIDYRKWFENLNLLGDTIVTEDLITGIESSFSVVN